MSSFLRPLLLALCALGGGMAWAASIKLEPVETTTGTESHFAEAVDGIETTANGWVVQQSTPQAGVFRSVQPLEAGRVRVSFSFYGSQKNSYCDEFSISATTDSNPSLTSHWETIFPIAFNTDQGWLERAYPRIRMLGTVTRANVRVDGVVPDDRVTGIRIDVWPSPKADANPAILTELHLDRTPLRTTNIALGCPVSTSHRLSEKQYAEFLTDGLVGSYAHPADARVGPDFYFQIDLRRVRTIDHISLRSRSESATMNRFTNLHLQLFEEEPTADTPPTWSGVDRGNGQVPEPGAVDVVRAAAGEGLFRGRYLRIFSTGPAPYSPQIAEVEVYESIVMPGAGVMANDHPLKSGPQVRIPAGSNWLSFTLGKPRLPDGLQLGARWRILGMRDEWQPANSTNLVERRGLPPGEYLFEAQMRHTDLEWNSESLRVPLVVLAPWWKKPAAQGVAVAGLIGIAALLAWQISRRRLAQRLAELERRQELSRERARIARDMHDVVGARLTQLTVMHELFEARHSLPDGAANQLHELTTIARSAVSALDEAVWAVNPRNDTLQNVADYLCHAAGDYLRPLNIGVRQDVPETWPAREIGAQKRHELFLSFKEALQNVVKHAGATVVRLTLRFEEPEFIVWVDDNGRGLDPGNDRVEKDGLENMRTRISGVGGRCTVQARDAGGTRVELRLPV